MSGVVFRVVRDGEDTSDLIARFAARYPNQGTAAQYAGMLRRLERDTGLPAHQLHADDLIRWCATPGLANNSVRGRASAVVVFLRWCHRNEIPAADPALLTDRDSPLRTYRPTYGKAQSANPGRWLTKEQAFGQLVAVCQDGTPTGLRDELVIRCGLATMRATEIATVTVGQVHLNTDPAEVVWLGKHRKTRRTEPGPGFVDALERWLALYADAVGELDQDLPLLCPSGRGRRFLSIAWGQPFGSNGKHAIFRIVTRRAKQAGLGHVAPHDLKRTNAAILHRAKTPEGAHFFDLRDIQQVHGHSDPGTTIRSYIEPMDTDVIGRAGSMVD